MEDLNGPRRASRTCAFAVLLATAGANFGASRPLLSSRADDRGIAWWAGACLLGSALALPVALTILAM